MRRLTLEGVIVLSVGVFGHAEGIELPEEVKTQLDELHKRKIDLADEILVINVNGYIGKSTTGEIAYAVGHGKVVRYLEPAIRGMNLEQSPTLAEVNARRTGEGL